MDTYPPLSLRVDWDFLFSAYFLMYDELVLCPRHDLIHDKGQLNQEVTIFQSPSIMFAGSAHRSMSTLFFVGGAKVRVILCFKVPGGKTRRGF